MALRKLNPKSSLKTDEKIDWSRKGLNEWKKKIRERATKRDDRDPPKILFMGETGSGKSSYISSVVSALSGDITYTSTIGEHVGREVNTSKRYLEHRVFIAGEDVPLNFILCDSRGIAKRKQEGVTDREIKRLIDGKLRHNDFIESERSSDGVLIDSRTPQPPSCVVFVQKAQRLGEVDSDVEEKLKQAAEIVRGRGIPSCVILTHIDKVKPSLEKNLETALESEKIQERVIKASKDVGVNSNRVFVVKNYTDERRTHKRQDILILRALDAILVDAYRGSREEGVRNTDRRPMSTPEHLYYTLPSQSATLPSPGGHLSSANSGRRSFSGDGESAGQIVVHQRFYSEPAPQRTHALQAGCIPSSDVPKDATATPTETFKRSSQYCGHLIPKNDQSPPGSKSDSDDSQAERDSKGDDGIGGSLVSGPDYHISFLQKTINTFDQNPFPRSYSEKAEVQGAKPLFNPTIVQMGHTSKTSRDSDSRLSRHLPKAMNSSEDMDDYRRFDAVLQNVARGDTGSIWMSKTLPLDLGLPLECFPPVSMIIQALFLAPGHPVFLVTVFDPEKVREDETFDREEDSRQMVAEETEETFTYTVQMGKLLTTALLNYCCCDFILLPCIIKSRDLNPTSLEDEVRKQVAASRIYYGGPEKLSENSYRQLKEAATIVTGVSHVPRFLGVLDRNQGHLVLMDPDWRGVVSLLIEDLTNSQKQHVTYPKEGKVKMHVAVIEAAKRLSFTEAVAIITPNEKVQECCRLLKDQVLEDTGLELKLSVVNPGDVDQPDALHVADYIVLLDCSNDVEVLSEDAVVLRVSEGSNDRSRV